ncbi:protein phosphatase 1 regulatory subunit 35 [Narcine bancroftii]|uniref:protein phosphatase 1 regulatory subunit 35 n=1 Tax=Narcine bancroftii TaxID=1343680 RepID=UPI0038313361
MYAPQNYTDEDSLPISTAPRPLFVGPAQVDSASDLDVSLTPEKISKCVGILKRQEKAVGEGSSGRISHRQVRFDTGREAESCDGEGLTQGSPQSVRPAQEADPNTNHPPPSPPAGRQESVLPHRGSKKDRAVKPVTADRAVEPPRRLGATEDHPLAVPGLNTTLALQQELQQLKEEGFDARKAAADRLGRSSVTRQCVEGKVSEGLNVPKDLQRYKGLVSLEVPVDKVLNLAIQEKMSLVKTRADNKKHPAGAESPDLTVFCQVSDLLNEVPHLAVDGLPTLKVQPQPKPAVSAFNLYQKLKQWNV